MKIESEQIEKNGILEVANLMCLAARTAPKARGTDLLATAIITEDDINVLADKMLEVAKTGYRSKTFERDAHTLVKATAVVLIGTKAETIGLDCGFCNFKNCDELTEKQGICAFNSGDLGIALGSAVSVAANHRVDNRVMYTAGWASIKMALLGKDIKIAYGIPLSCTGKNIFFERK